MNESLRAWLSRSSVALMLGVTSGCYTTQNVVTMSPMQTRYPVSASAYYLDSSGAVVDDEHYTVQRPFEFETTISAPRHDRLETPLQLEPELDKIMSQAGGDAITNLRVEAVNYDAGSHGSAAGWKITGWTFGLMGGALVLSGVAVDDDSKARGTLVAMGGVFAGIGVLGFLAGAVASKPASWQFKVTGQVVKASRAASEVAAPAPAVAAPPAAGPAPTPAIPPAANAAPIPGGSSAEPSEPSPAQ